MKQIELVMLAIDAKTGDIDCIGRRRPRGCKRAFIDQVPIDVILVQWRSPDVQLLTAVTGDCLPCGSKKPSPSELRMGDLAGALGPLRGKGQSATDANYLTPTS